MEIDAGLEKGKDILAYQIQQFLNIARFRKCKAFFRRVLHYVKRSDRYSWFLISHPSFYSKGSQIFLLAPFSVKFDFLVHWMKNQKLSFSPKWFVGPLVFYTLNSHKSPSMKLQSDCFPPLYKKRSITQICQIRNMKRILFVFSACFISKIFIVFCSE